MKTVEIYLGKDLVTTVNNVSSLEKTFENELLLKDEKGETIAYFCSGYSYVVIMEDIDENESIRNPYVKIHTI